jgi:hypothetical protein
MAIKPDSVAQTLITGTLTVLERELGRKWTLADSLPACPHCGAPEAPGIVGGVLCISSEGRPVNPHVVRLVAWRRRLRGN